MLKLWTFTALLSLLGWSSASACSPSQMVMTGEQNYQALKPSAYSSWSDPELSIGLVYAKKKKTRKRDVFTGYGGPEKKPFVKIKFRLIENISGDYVKDEATWFPKIDSAGERRELGRIGKPKSFAFWDRRGLSTPQIQGYSVGTSCGPMPSTTLLPGQHYLHFKKGERTVGLEIVSGPDDPLVLNFIEAAKGLAESKIRRTPKDYFEEISGYQEFVLKACPTEMEIELITWGSYGGPTGPTPLLNVSQKSDYNSDFGDLKLIDFISYQNHVQGRDWKCEIGKRYLVLDKVSPRLFGRDVTMFSVNPPRHRYIEISNGMIDTNDILSHISILPNEVGQTHLDVEQVKRWIRDANSKLPPIDNFKRSLGAATKAVSGESELEESFGEDVAGIVARFRYFPNAAANICCTLAVEF